MAPQCDCPSQANINRSNSPEHRMPRSHNAKGPPTIRIWEAFAVFNLAELGKDIRRCAYLEAEPYGMKGSLVHMKAELGNCLPIQISTPHYEPALRDSISDRRTTWTEPVKTVIVRLILIHRAQRPIRVSLIVQMAIGFKKCILLKLQGRVVRGPQRYN